MMQNWVIQEKKLENQISWYEKEVEDPGIDPGTSRMLSERSTIWANPPCCLTDWQVETDYISVRILGNCKKYLPKPGIEPGTFRSSV